jgi:hypothetical protein
LAFSVTTNRRSYAPGQEVVMTTTATNVSGSPCSAVVGRDRGYSPSFLVTSSKGETVWDRCWVDDQPGACFDILVTYPLSRGQSFIETARWDQLSGGPSTVPRQVPPGRYDETSDYFQGSASTNFVLRPAHSHIRSEAVISRGRV